MKILSLYILRKHIGPFIFAVFTITMIFLASYLIERVTDLLSRDVLVTVIAEMLVLSIAWVIALAVPMSVLISTLMAFGKMSADNEITAMKASGYGLHQAMLPILILSIFLAELIKDYSLLFREIDNSSDWVYGVTIFDKSDRKIYRSVIAEKATLTFNEQSDQIVLVLYDGEIHEVDMQTLQDYKKSNFSQFTIRIPIESSELVRRDKGSRSDRSKTIAVMRKDIKRSSMYIGNTRDEMISQIEMRIEDNIEEMRPHFDIINRLDISDFSKSQNGMYAIDNYLDNPLIKEISRFPALMNMVWRDIQSIDSQIRYQNKLGVEIHKKYSISIVCIVFVLIGVPLGVKARHGSVAVGAGLGMIFFLLYWLFLIGGEQLADRKLVEPWFAMWSPNILVGGWGLWLTIRMIRETTFLEAGRFGFIMRLLVRRPSEAEQPKYSIKSPNRDL